MHVSLPTLRTHIDYSRWANRRILEAASGLTPEELTRDFATADKSVLGTLLHVYGAELVWIERMYGTSLRTRPYDAHSGLETLQTAWPAVWNRWDDYVARLTEQGAEAEIHFVTFKGDAFHSPAWQIIMHIVNHGTHHRGQAAGFIRAMGKTPPVLDLMQYYREHA